MALGLSLYLVSVNELHLSLLHGGAAGERK